jgi:hypothetical protein
MQTLKPRTVESVSEAKAYVMKQQPVQTRRRQFMDQGAGRHVITRTFYWYEGNETHCTYTVYSYGRHFPMFVWDSKVQKWYGNKDKSSRTTSKHMNKLRPKDVELWLTTEALQYVADNGITAWVESKIGDAV